MEESVKYVFGCPPSNYIYAPELSGCRLSISAANSTAHVNITTIDDDLFLTLQPSEIYIMNFDEKYIPQNGTENKGVMISSSHEIHVFVEQLDLFYDPPYRFDSTQVLPQQKLTGPIDYFLSSYMNPTSACSLSYNIQFYTMAAEVQTHIQIYEDMDVEIDLELQPYQTYTFVTTIAAGDAYYDSTGKLVRSSNPVNIVSGTLCARNPYPGGGYAAFITGIQPTGSRHYVAPILGNVRDTGYTLRIIARENNTQIQVEGEEYNRNQSDFIEIDFAAKTSISTINCDRDCNAYIILRSYDQEVGSALTNIIASDKLYTSAYFATPDYDFQHYLSLVLEGESPYHDVILDGQSLADQDWESSDGFSYMWMEVSNGSHWLLSTDVRGFAAYLYGHSGNYGGGYGHSILSGKYFDPLAAVIYWGW